MKIDKFLSICTFTAILMSSCSDDLGLQPEDKPVAGISQTLRIGASLSEGDSRLAFTDGAEKVTLGWEADDALKVINSTQNSSITSFGLVEGAGSAFGVFEGTVTGYTQDDQLYALYHNNLVESNIDENGNIALSLKEQSGTLNEDYQLMFGAVKYGTGNAIPAVTLNHLVSVFAVTLPVPEGKTLTEMTMMDGARWSNNLRSNATLVIKQNPSTTHEFKAGDLIYNSAGEETVDNGAITVKGEFTPDESGNVTVYFYVLPSKFYDEYNFSDIPYITPSFTAVIDGQEYVSTGVWDHRHFNAGKMYQLSTGIFPVVEFESGNGTEANPYVIANEDQFISFMLRCNKRHLYNKEYHNSHYKLTADIHLDGNVPWQSFDFGGTFDGGNHKITGIMQNAMFETVRGATIKNLVLDLESLEYPYYTDMGRLARLVAESTIINCVNHSDLIGAGGSFAGLVHCLENNSRMIACVNTGDITARCQMIGGLAGILRFGATMEACYSTGTITCENDDAFSTVYLGGLVGTINYPEYKSEEFGNASMIACWTNMKITETDKMSESSQWGITGYGTDDVDFSSCFWTNFTPSVSSILEMNGVMTNGMYEFDSTNGYIIPILPGTSLPEYDIEEL